MSFSPGTRLVTVDSPVHGDSHAAPTFTQSFVSGQQVGESVLQSVSEAHVLFDAVRQCFASGQQYSVALQTEGATQSAPAFTQSFVTGQQMGKAGSLHAFAADGSHCVLDGVRHFLASGQ